MSDFTEYASKKRLAAANVLTDEQLAFIDSIRCVFTMSLHEQRRYMALTLYHSATKEYSYLVADLLEKATAKSVSIKQAKQDIRERVAHTDDTSTLIPRPSCGEVDKYLQQWNTTADLYEPEKVLRQLFTEAHPTNTAIDDIILKVAALNTVYNTYIYSVYPVAQHILSLNIDGRLRVGDETLVNELMRVIYSESEKKDHYSFATKYCSFHNPSAYPIFDSYVEKIMLYFRDTEKFASFKNSELRNYPTFKKIVAAFITHFGLEKYSVKQIDQYLWQFGKEYFK